jgi:hypothetical protein
LLEYTEVLQNRSILKELADPIFVNYFENSFVVEKTTFSMPTNAWQHHVQQIEIRGEKIVLFAVTICRTVCHSMGQMIFVSPIERSFIEVFQAKIADGRLI